MKKHFTSSDASRLIRQHNFVLDELSQSQKFVKDAENSIKRALSQLVACEVMNILRDIPIEELSKHKKGIKLKALSDAGYHTIADICAASVYSISSIYGISEDGAYTIKNIASNISKKTSSTVKIKLSTDNKSQYATALIVSISKYLRLKKLSDDCAITFRENKNSVSALIKSLSPATGFFNWLFASKNNKQEAICTYDKLTELLNSDYFIHANYLLNEIGNTLNLKSAIAWDDFSQNSIHFFNVIEILSPGVLGNSDSVYGLPEHLASKVQDECFFPDGLLCTLRRYQEWGVKYILHQHRVLLGDEMGLGKTIQAIAAMVSLKNTGATHFMVVCPAGVVTNWCREIAKHSLLKPIKIHGNGKLSAFRSWLSLGGVAVTTYETVASLNLEEGMKFSLLVVDEAHYIKNPTAKRTKNTLNLSLHFERLLFMTGTALENKVDEMIWLISILQPQIANQAKSIAFMSSANQFREAVSPVYYRRKRKDVLTELPDLIETQNWCTLNPKEEEVYENAILDGNYQESRRVSWSVDDLSLSSKATRLREIIEEAKADGRKILIFSFFLDTIRKIHDFLGDICLNPINGSVTPQRRQEIIDEFEKAPEGTVLIAQINSGGTGLNIQAASVVVICEPQFKPSIENQAISRSYRMGQSRNVLVYRLLCENTIDEHITSILEEKQKIFDAFADKSVAAQQTASIDDASFGDIIKKEIDRINKKRGNDTSSVSASNLGNDEYYDSLFKLDYYQLVYTRLQQLFLCLLSLQP